MLNKKESLIKKTDMYLDKTVARKMVERQQNEKNFQVADALDRIIIEKLKSSKDSLHIAELGGGAHIDRYDQLFKELLERAGSRIDWVENSKVMLDLAGEYLGKSEYKERKKVLNFVHQDMMKYLEDLEDQSLDLVIMKYTFDYVVDLESFFDILYKKLKKDSSLVSTMTTLSPELKSISTNARFLYNGEEFGEDEIRILEDGDTFTIKFFKESGNPKSGYIEGAETTKYFFTKETIGKIARQVGFEVFLGDWKGCVSEEEKEGNDVELDVLVAEKK